MKHPQDMKRQKSYATLENPFYEPTSTALRRYQRDIAAKKCEPYRGESGRLQEASLVARIRKGDRAAQERFVHANLRFVVSVATQYQNRGLPLEDLIQEGNIGLLTAIEKFDEERNVKLISYAVWWIRQAILKALAEQVRIVRLPLNIVDDFTKLNKVMDRHEWQLTDEELASETGLGLSKIRQRLVQRKSPIYLDAYLDGEEEKETLHKLIPSQELAPDHLCTQTALSEEIEKALSTLEPREAEVIELHFGINQPGGGMTLEQIGDRFGVTRERIRQIKQEAIQKLRHPTRAEKLKPYAEEIIS